MVERIRAIRRQTRNEAAAVDLSPVLGIRVTGDRFHGVRLQIHAGMTGEYMHYPAAVDLPSHIARYVAEAMINKSGYPLELPAEPIAPVSPKGPDPEDMRPARLAQIRQKIEDNDPDSGYSDDAYELLGYVDYLRLALNGAEAERADLLDQISRMTHGDFSFEGAQS